MVRWLAAAVPLVLLVICQIRYSVDVVFADEWSYVPFIQKVFEGNVLFKDFLAAHNEHRTFFPQLILAALIRLSRWNMAWELAFNLGVAILIVAVLSRAVTRTFRVHGMAGKAWVPAVIGSFVFSLHQVANWFFGMQLIFFLPQLAAVLGLCLLARPNLHRRHVVGGWLCGVVAIGSFASGLAYWPAAAVILATAPAENRGTRWRRVGVWALAAAPLVLAYLWFYRRPAHHPTLLSSLEHPLTLVQYVLFYLGAPLFPAGLFWSGFAGALGLAASGWVITRLRRAGVSLQEISLYMGLIFYTGGVAFLTALGRSGGFGLGQARSSRYILFSGMLWVALLVLLALWRAGLNRSLPRHALAAVIGGIIALNGLQSVVGIRLFRYWHDRLVPVRAALIAGPEDEWMERMMPHTSPALRKKRIDVMRRHRLSVFRNQP